MPEIADFHMAVRLPEISQCYCYNSSLKKPTWRKITVDVMLKIIEV